MSAIRNAETHYYHSGRSIWAVFVEGILLVDREDSLLHNVPYSRYQLATGSGVYNMPSL